MENTILNLTDYPPHRAAMLHRQIAEDGCLSVRLRLLGDKMGHSSASLRRKTMNMLAALGH